MFVEFSGARNSMKEFEEAAITHVGYRTVRKRSKSTMVVSLRVRMSAWTLDDRLDAKISLNFGESRSKKKRESLNSVVSTYDEGATSMRIGKDQDGRDLL